MLASGNQSCSASYYISTRDVRRAPKQTEGRRSQPSFECDPQYFQGSTSLHRPLLIRGEYIELTYLSFLLEASSTIRVLPFETVVLRVINPEWAHRVDKAYISRGPRRRYSFYFMFVLNLCHTQSFGTFFTNFRREDSRYNGASEMFHIITLFRYSYGCDQSIHYL